MPRTQEKPEPQVGQYWTGVGREPLLIKHHEQKTSYNERGPTTVSAVVFEDTSWADTAWMKRDHSCQLAGVETPRGRVMVGDRRLSYKDYWCEVLNFISESVITVRMKGVPATCETIMHVRDFSEFPLLDEPPVREAPVRVLDHGALRDKSSLMESLAREIDQRIEDTVQKFEEAPTCSRDPYFEHRRKHNMGPDESVFAPPPAEPYLPQRLSRFDAIAAEKSRTSQALRATPGTVRSIYGKSTKIEKTFDEFFRKRAIDELFATDTSIAAHFREMKSTDNKA